MLIRILKAVFMSSLGVGAAGLLIVTIAWIVLLGLYFGSSYFYTRGHLEFAANGVSQIEPALQMDQLFDDCRHFITYSGRDSVSTWNSVAYFGGRYVLTMQVPVSIQSRGKGEAIGEPRFHLNEVSRVEISPSGQISARFSNNFEFSAPEWSLVRDAKGDFGVIGFKMNTGPPIKDFDAYAKASR